MRLSGYQPQYFPRLHYFARALNSDIFEISDYLQFVKKHVYPTANRTFKRGKSYQAHTPIKLSFGIFNLGVPTHDELAPINKTRIDYSKNWAYKHLKSIQTAHSKSANFSKFFPEIEAILSQKYENLAKLNIATILWGFARLLTDEKINLNSVSVEMINKILARKNPFKLKKIFIASESPVPPPSKGTANDWIIALCKFANATEYHYGSTSHAAYMDFEKFAKAGIKLSIQNWQCPVYQQQYMKLGFIPNLSVIDLIMNESLATRQKVIKGGKSENF